MAYELPPLPNVIIEPIIRMALEEDYSTGGDVTADLFVPTSKSGTLYFHARDTGVIAGMQAAELTFKLVDPELKFKIVKGDGSPVKKGTHIATISGPSRSLLMSERVALNFLGHLSGVATLTSKYVALANGKARIAATRKTTPGLRALEKRAVQAGGGFPHRQGLSSAIMIKDNHIALAGGIEAAVKAIKERADHMTHVSVEVDTLEQFAKVLPYKPNVILLDNMSNDMLREAVALNQGSGITLEASGGVNLDTVAGIASTGVDVISVGALTHSATNFDIGLDAKKKR